MYFLTRKRVGKEKFAYTLKLGLVRGLEGVASIRIRARHTCQELQWFMVALLLLFIYRTRLFY